MKFVIYGNPVTKKNSQRLIVRNGRPYIIPSKNYLAYEQMALRQIMAYGIKDFPEFDFPIGVPVNVCCVYYMQTRRRVDICNLHSAIHDILTKAGVIEDDNRDIIATTDGSCVLYDKNDPRIEIEISSLGEGYIQWAKKKELLPFEPDETELYEGLQ